VFVVQTGQAASRDSSVGGAIQKHQTGKSTRWASPKAPRFPVNVKR